MWWKKAKKSFMGECWPPSSSLIWMLTTGQHSLIKLFICFLSSQKLELVLFSEPWWIHLLWGVCWRKWKTKERGKIWCQLHLTFYHDQWSMTIITITISIIPIRPRAREGEVLRSTEQRLPSTSLTAIRNQIILITMRMMISWSSLLSLLMSLFYRMVMWPSRSFWETPRSSPTSRSHCWLTDWPWNVDPWSS